MRFACDNCQTKYLIPDERVRGKILKIRCKTCQSLVTISEGGARTATIGEAAAGPVGIPARQWPGNALIDPDQESADWAATANFFRNQRAAESQTADEWHLSVDGNQDGPIPLDNLVFRIIQQEGTSSEIFVWREGFDGWKEPDGIPEIQNAIRKARGTNTPPIVADSDPASAPMVRDEAEPQLRVPDRPVVADATGNEVSAVGMAPSIPPHAALLDSGKYRIVSDQSEILKAPVGNAAATNGQFDDTLTEDAASRSVVSTQNEVSTKREEFLWMEEGLGFGRWLDALPPFLAIPSGLVLFSGLGLALLQLPQYWFAVSIPLVVLLLLWLALSGKPVAKVSFTILPPK